MNTIADAMWYIDQNHATLSSRGYPVPDTFRHFSGFRQPERQKKCKIDSSFLHQEELKAHGSALYNLAVSSYLKKDAWKPIQTSIVSLADSLTKYGNYLANQNKRVSAYLFIFLKSFSGKNTPHCISILGTYGADNMFSKFQCIASNCGFINIKP